MKKEFLLFLALLTFGYISAQEKGPSMIAENKADKNIKIEVTKEKKKKEVKKSAKKNKSTSIPQKTIKKYYINSSGQKTYID